MIGRLSVWALATLLVACGGDGGEGEGRGRWGGGGAVQRATVVEVAPVARGAVVDVLSSSAAVESEKAADLFPVASGIVVEVRAEEGDAVRRGQVLAVLDNASLDAGSRRASAEVERLEAEVARVERLHAQGAVSSRELQEMRYSLETARTSAWEAGRTQGETRIKSPIDGVVAARDVRVGELASSARRAFQVVDLDRLRVVAALPERDLARVREGQPARLVSAYDPDLWGVGTVARVAPVVDPSSGTFRVTVDLEPGQGALRPGQFVSVEIEVDRHEGVLVVPREAVVYEDGAPIVYRMIEAPPEDPDSDSDSAGEAPAGRGWGRDRGAPRDADSDSDSEADTEAGPKHVAERVRVQLGLVDAVSAEIVEGLAEGDPVVVIGQSNLRDGAPIRTPGEPAAAVAPGDADAEGPG